MKCLAALVGCALLVSCKREPPREVCGLHAASAPVVKAVAKGKPKPVPVGARLSTDDRIEAHGDALLECFGGAFRALRAGERVRVGDLVEAGLEGGNWPTQVLREGKLERVTAARSIVIARYSAAEFTPPSARGDSDEAGSTADYLRIFFTPNGVDKMVESAARPEGPSQLPPPPLRPKVPFIHAGELGEGGATARVEDGFAVAETDDLATGVLLEDRTVALGRTRRLVLPPGAELELRLGAGAEPLELEGPLDIRLR